MWVWFKSSLLATPDTNLFLALAGLERGAVVDQQAFKVGVQDSVVGLNADCKGRSIRVVAQGIHERDENTVLGDELTHSTTPIWSELRLDRAEEAGGREMLVFGREQHIDLLVSVFPLRVIVDKLESSCGDIKLEKVSLQELGMRLWNFLLGADLQKSGGIAENKKKRFYELP